VATVRLPTSAFRVLSDRLGIQVPAVINVLPTAFHPEQQRAELDEVMAGLLRRGLVDSRGEIDETLAGRLRILDQARCVVDVVAHIAGPVNAVLAAGERRAVLIIQSGQQVAVSLARPTRVGEQAARLLPDVPAGYGRSISTPTETLQKAAAEAGGDTRSLETALQRHGVRRDSAHMIAVMNQAPVHTAQFGVTINDNGRRHRGEHVIGWWRNESGGYLNQEHTSASGEPWTTVAPADPARMAGQIDKLIDTSLRHV
jgi:ESX secretion-associated protein EspG